MVCDRFLFTRDDRDYSWRVQPEYFSEKNRKYHKRLMDSFIENENYNWKQLIMVSYIDSVLAFTRIFDSGHKDMVGRNIFTVEGICTERLTKKSLMAIPSIVAYMIENIEVSFRDEYETGDYLREVEIDFKINPLDTIRTYFDGKQDVIVFLANIIGTERRFTSCAIGPNIAEIKDTLNRSCDIKLFLDSNLKYKIDSLEHNIEEILLNKRDSRSGYTANIGLGKGNDGKCFYCWKLLNESNNQVISGSDCCIDNSVLIEKLVEEHDKIEQYLVLSGV